MSTIALCRLGQPIIIRSEPGFMRQTVQITVYSILMCPVSYITDSSQYYLSSAFYNVALFILSHYSVRLLMIPNHHKFTKPVMYVYKVLSKNKMFWHIVCKCWLSITCLCNDDIHDFIFHLELHFTCKPTQSGFRFCEGPEMGVIPPCQSFYGLVPVRS